MVMKEEEHNESEIQKLEGEIFELRSRLQDSHKKEMFYQEILSEINNSINELFEIESENERFRLDAEIDYRECLKNLKKSLAEYKRVYKINF
jgi:hypothetical protein